MEGKPKQTPAAEIDLLNKRITELEQRLDALEKGMARPGARVQIRATGTTGSSHAATRENDIRRNGSIESRMGEYGMAWLGNIVLLFGILFLTQLLQKNDQPFFSVLLGLVSVSGIYLAGRYTRKSFPYMSTLFGYNGHFVLFITAMRLHILAGSRIIESAFLGNGIVLVVILSLLYLAFRNRSQILTVIVWIMAVVTAIASGSSHLMLSILVGIAWTSIWFAYRNNWWNGLTISIVLIYFTFLIWIAGNPFVSGSFQFISSHQSGHIYLFIIALSYSMLALMPKSERIKEQLLNSVLTLNGLGFSFIMTLAVLSFFTHNYYIYFGLIAAFCMGYSILLQARGSWKVAPAMYAIYSFVALSITIGGIYKFPLAFFLLSIQSLLVVSMALWFRSRFIVIMNTLLFVSLLITYLVTSGEIIFTDFSFAIIALITARILNWKKERLEIRTELIRNIFLFIGAAMLLFSLHQAVPANFVTLSWALSALVFFTLSVLIRNIKYRWLAIITMVVTVFYLFIVDLKNISLGYRIVALLFISIISLGISFFYSRRVKHREEEDEGESASR